MNKKIGYNVYTQRIKAKITRNQLAAELGIGATAVGNIETGRNYPRVPQIRKMVKLFGCTYGDLLDDHGYRIVTKSQKTTSASLIKRK